MILDRSIANYTEQQVGCAFHHKWLWSSQWTLNTLNLQFKYTKHTLRISFAFPVLSCILVCAWTNPIMAQSENLLLKNIDSFLKIVWQLTEKK